MPVEADTEQLDGAVLGEKVDDGLDVACLKRLVEPGGNVMNRGFRLHELSVSGRPVVGRCSGRQWTILNRLF
jgi:hypothetical protein